MKGKKLVNHCTIALNAILKYLRKIKAALEGSSTSINTFNIFVSQHASAPKTIAMYPCTYMDVTDDYLTLITTIVTLCELNVVM